MSSIGADDSLLYRLPSLDGAAEARAYRRSVQFWIASLLLGPVATFLFVVLPPVPDDFA